MKVRGPVSASPPIGGGTNDAPVLGMSAFAEERNKPGLGKTYFAGDGRALVALVHEHWHRRVPGDGHRDLEHVVKVPVPPAGFMTAVLRRSDAAEVFAVREQRREHEEPYVAFYARGEPAPARYAEVILYSRQHLQRSNEDHDARLDWEIVALIAGPGQGPEPMSPMTMARNQLKLPGGSYAEYNGDQYAASILSWNEHAGQAPVGKPLVRLSPPPDPTPLLEAARRHASGAARLTGLDFARQIVAWHRQALG